MSVAFDAVGPGATGDFATGASIVTGSRTWSHTTSGVDRALFVSISVGVATPGTDVDTVVTGVTYAGTAMTFVGRRHANDGNAGYAELWVLANPALGANTVSVQFTSTGNNSSVEEGSTSFTGVDQTTPYDGFVSSVGASTAPSVAITSAVGSMTLDMVASGGVLSAPTQTNRWLENQDTASAAGCAGQSTATGAASVTHGYTIAAGDWWAMLGVNVRAVAPARLRRRSWAPLGRRRY
jgi:hypothetical protein